MSQPDERTRRLVQRRDAWKCARCGRDAGTHWSGDSIHHRRPRSHPWPGLHQPANLLLLCGSGTTGCHGWVHAHPARAYRPRPPPPPRTTPPPPPPAEPPSDQPGYIPDIKHPKGSRQ